MPGAQLRSRLSPTFRARRIARDSDAGSSIVEVTLVIVLLIGLFLAVVQIGAFFYVRSVIAASAADGARWAANVGASPADGAARATQRIGEALSPSMAGSVPCTGWTDVDPATGLELIAVRCVGTIRSIFVPIGSLVTIDVRSRALREGPS